VSNEGYIKLNSTSVTFYVNNAPWVDVRYVVNDEVQQNIRMIHNADNTNSYTVTGIPAGASVKYFFTVGQTLGAIDTAWAQFSM
jgi:hypothetical protein